ncbi:hypothetical protein [Roseibium sp.]|uniref:hypothetical protein n=1 Tax=Roseibium sp. TaxID=1936156 RepID=UPI003B521F78
MTISCGNDTHILRNGPQELRVHVERIASFLRRKHPANTAAEVACRIPVPVRTVERWFSGSPSVPSSEAILWLIWVYGPEFLTVLMPETPDWLSKAARNAKREKLLSEIEELEQQLNN